MVPHGYLSEDEGCNEDEEVCVMLLQRVSLFCFKTVIECMQYMDLLYLHQILLFIFFLSFHFVKNMTIFLFYMDSHSFVNDHKFLLTEIHVSSMLLELFMSNWFPPGHLTSGLFL